MRFLNKYGPGEPWPTREVGRTHVTYDGKLYVYESPTLAGQDVFMARLSEAFGAPIGMPTPKFSTSIDVDNWHVCKECGVPGELVHSEDDVGHWSCGCSPAPSGHVLVLRDGNLVIEKPGSMFEISSSHLKSDQRRVFGGHRALADEYGVVLFVDEPDRTTPAWLVPILRMAVDLGASVIVFSEDGPLVVGLTRLGEGGEELVPVLAGDMAVDDLQAFWEACQEADVPLHKFSDPTQGFVEDIGESAFTEVVNSDPGLLAIRRSDRDFMKTLVCTTMNKVHGCW